MSSPERNPLADLNIDTDNENSQMLPENDDPAEGSKENEPQPKRQRGRPRKDTLAEIDDLGELRRMIKQRDEEIRHLKSNLKTRTRDLNARVEAAEADRDAIVTDSKNSIKLKDEHIASLRDQIATIMDDNDEKESRMLNLESRLQQKENEYSDLLEQLDQMDTSVNSSNTCSRPKMLALVDNITQPLSNQLHQKFEWHTLLATSVLDPPSNLHEFDGILLFFGTDDLLSGTSPNRLLSSVSKLAEAALKVDTIPVCVQLPPIDVKTVAGRVALFNYKLSKIPETQWRCINIDVSSSSKYDFLEADGKTLSTKGTALFSKIINNELAKIEVVIKSPRTKTSQSEPTGSYKVYHAVKPASVGKIIGRGGHVIKKLATDYNVNISVGKWYEKVRGSDKHEEISDAVTLTGSIGDINDAINEIEKICDSK